MGVTGAHTIPTCVPLVSTTLPMIIEPRHMNARGLGHDYPHIAIDHQGMNATDNNGYGSYKGMYCRYDPCSNGSSQA